MTTATSLGEKLLANIAYLEKNPSAARAAYRAQTRLNTGTQCSATVRKFPEILVDEPPELGGADSGPNPVELLLVALGTCQEITYHLYANMMGIELDSLTVDLKGNMDFRGVFNIDDSVPAGYQKITFETRIESSADAATIRKLVETVEASCPVLDCLKRPVDVGGKVVLNGEPVTST